MARRTLDHCRDASSPGAILSFFGGVKAGCCGAGVWASAGAAMANATKNNAARFIVISRRYFKRSLKNATTSGQDCSAAL